MELADHADVLRQRGLEGRSIQVYQRALAEAEAAVWLSTRSGAGVKTLSIFYRSAALLAMDCHEWRKAQNLIKQGIESLPSDSLEEELKGLLKRLPLAVDASVLEAPDRESHGATTLQSDVEIKGALYADHDLMFDGTLEGEIVALGELTLGANANVQGEITARSLELFGKVQGHVIVEDTCRIFPNAVLLGDLKASYLVLERGASLIGQSQIGPKMVSDGHPTRATNGNANGHETMEPAASNPESFRGAFSR
jgi:cytoskeletal protein CcmA (bactofilin family)